MNGYYLITLLGIFLFMAPFFKIGNITNPLLALLVGGIGFLLIIIGSILGERE